MRRRRERRLPLPALPGEGAGLAGLPTAAASPPSPLSPSAPPARPSDAAQHPPAPRPPSTSAQVSVFRTGGAQRRLEAARPPAGLALSPRAWRGLTSKLQRLLLLVHQILELKPRAADGAAEAAPPPQAERGQSRGPEQEQEQEPEPEPEPEEQEGQEPTQQQLLLIYTQWLAHVQYVAQLLRRAGVPALALSGDLEHCMRCLSRFGSAGAPRVLVLSSQHHASGINLQCATSLIILHPYCTPTAADPSDISYAQLAAYEAQAVGRIRRYPQTRTVRVYRVFAQGTIEESLYAARGAPVRGVG